MEHRKAPSGYARQTLIVFEITGAIGGAIGLGTAVAIYFVWPSAPIWAFGFAFGLGFVVFSVLVLRMRPKFKCPQCGMELGRQDIMAGKDGEPIRFVCRTCEIAWETGLSHITN